MKLFIIINPKLC